VVEGVERRGEEKESKLNQTYSVIRVTGGAEVRGYYVTAFE
jgi:hypothetical protein